MRIASLGNMTLIDTPGFNDPNKIRSDKHIHMEFVGTVREILKSPHEGISSFIQCILPDESDRIRKSSIKTMMNFLLMLSVFNRDTTVEEIMRCHPKMEEEMSQSCRHPSLVDQ